jgi:hypothetical protein
MMILLRSLSFPPNNNLSGRSQTSICEDSQLTNPPATIIYQVLVNGEGARDCHLPHSALHSEHLCHKSQTWL